MLARPGRTIRAQSSGPIRYAIVEGLDVYDSRVRWPDLQKAGYKLVVHDLQRSGHQTTNLGVRSSNLFGRAS